MGGFSPNEAQLLALGMPGLVGGFKRRRELV